MTAACLAPRIALCDRMVHLRYSGRPAAEQREALFGILLADPIVTRALEAAARLDLPDWWIVSGVLYNTVWNALTGRTSGYGIKDIDLFYCDASDLSWEAEDAVIRRGAKAFAELPLPVEIRNQARVHLWYESRFGIPCPRIECSKDSIDRFASKTHAVALRLKRDGDLELYAPYGLDNIFSFRIVPNPVADNRDTHEAKAARAKANWPEITVVPWCSLTAAAWPAINHKESKQ